ncbi:phage protein [Bifidobacterium actinocoloniiforme DSM 22766]|uniref:Phage protein n=1 Tax=Bifidobacterium actinocoloniiforme DSM 22766 TaxID=1437605 RepID=A0A086Z1J3_9BIFI|nr:hypothetical protein [Bifidobacterium actinocoloniiforme]AKV55529.1 hypothetical protein AB656_04085 [Bifidobacterium actinocoloniiforme DSM 22766]KFI40393.1 phage protein [Bifidobacterium actinocoloniiforme DSM 22766]
MSRQKRKGTAFETQVLGYVRGRIGDPEGMIHREALHGNADEGDIKGLYIGGKSLVLECKDWTRFKLATWLDQAKKEAFNAGADYGMVVFHRPGKGGKQMGDQYVLMDLDTLARLAGAQEEES